MRRPAQAAFTLVELLVVIGIIALLISILLPALGKARAQANQAKCAANMRTAIQVLQLYGIENKGWMPGPYTSGAIWKSSSLQMSVTDSSSDETPTQNMDWVSPTYGKTFRWPENDYQRLRQIYNIQLKCPSNDLQFGGTYPSGALPFAEGLDSASYSAVVQFHTYPSRENPSSGVMSDTYQPTNGGLEPPAGYAPQLSKVGPAASKVFLVEGTRFIETTGTGATAKGGKITFNPFRYQKAGGNFMIGGPFQLQQNTPFNLPTNGNGYSGGYSELAKTYGWRHNGKMNLAFFDGHVEARIPAESIQISLYVPKGTRVITAANDWDPADKDGQILP